MVVLFVAYDIGFPNASILIGLLRTKQHVCMRHYVGMV
jgi:hypothetical protein